MNSKYCTSTYTAEGWKFILRRIHMFRFSYP